MNFRREADEQRVNVKGGELKALREVIKTESKILTLGFGPGLVNRLTEVLAT